MITQFLMDTILGLVQGIMAFVPAWGIDSSTIDQAKSIGLSAGSLDGWFPETFLFGCLAFVLAVRLWFLAWNAIQWAYHMIPFNGG